MIIQTETPNWIGGISYLRILATCSVVLLHTCSLLADYRSLFELTDDQYLFYWTIYHLMRWAVPVFFMITGALMIGRTIDYRVILRKYVLRMILALIILGFPFGIIKVYVEQKSISWGAIRKTLRMIVEGKASAPLWYLYALIGIYLVFPMINKTSEIARDSLLRLIGSLFAFDFLLPFISDLAHIDMAFYTPVGYTAFYVLIGCCIKKDMLQVLRRREIRIIGIAIPLILIFYSCKYNIFADEIVSYYSPCIALCAVCVFATFVYMKKEKLSVFVWKTDRLCFGVYLLHSALIQLIYRFMKLTPVMENRYVIATLVSYLGILVISFLGSWVLSYIKPLRKYVL